MVDKTPKTNTMRLLDSKKIPYVVHHYAAERMSAEEVAATLGWPQEQVFKTLVTLPDKGRPFLAIIPAGRELDLKKLAQAAGEKRMRMATYREAESLTGLQVGGISALALLSKGFKIYLDALANDQAQILVSAGQRGIQLQLAPKDLAQVTGAHLADISRPASQEVAQPEEL